MFEKIRKFKIKFINFKEKKDGKFNKIEKKNNDIPKINQNETVNMQKIREVRTFSYCCGFDRDWLY